MDRLDQLLILSVGVAMLGTILLLLRAYIEVRLRFESLLSSRRPEIWSELFPSQSRLEEAVRLTLKLSLFDASPRVASFRREDYRGLADPEVATWCSRANKAERVFIVSVFVLFGWTILAFALIIARRLM